MAHRGRIGDDEPGPSNGVARMVSRITKDLDFATQLTSLISEQGLTEKDARTIFSTLDPEELNKEIVYLKALDEVAKYEGFNPREMMRQLLLSHKTCEERIAANPELLEEVVGVITVNGREERFEFSSNQSFSKDMQFISLMFITRGAAYEKILKKSSELMKKCMQIMKVKYSINTVTRKPGMSLDAKTVTTPRIAASFPCITVGLFAKGFGRTIFDPSTLFPDQELPRVMYSPMMSSLLPKGEQAPLAIMLAIATKVDDILHQTGSKTSLTALYQYLLASYNSTATTEKLKMRYCVIWGLGNVREGTFTYSDIVTGTRQKAKDAIQRMRSLDPELGNILSKI